MIKNRNAPTLTATSDPLLVTREIAAKRYAISLRHLINLIDGGVIPVVRLGRAVRIPVAKADRVIESLVTGGMK